MNKVRFSICLSKDLIQKLDKVCEKEKRSRSNLIELAIEEKISKTTLAS